MTRIRIRSQLDYAFEEPTDILLQLEAAVLPEQTIVQSNLDLSQCDHFARVAAHDDIGERIWLQAVGGLKVDYTATVDIHRMLTDVSTLEAIPPHLLPGETVQYLVASRYCPSDRFEPFVEGEFGSLEGGAKALAMRDWIKQNIAYVMGSSGSHTTATDTFVERQGVCRDFAHLLVTLCRAAGIPARVAAVYALGVEPQDFHAVAEVFLADPTVPGGGAWHIVDATGMADAEHTAKIGIGRDAADVSFLTVFGPSNFNFSDVSVLSNIPQAA